MEAPVETNKISSYQLFPDLSDEEYQSLKTDIATHGILVPVEKDEHGNILDGHHRIRAWEELRQEGIKVPDFPRLVRPNLTEEQKHNHIRCLNLLRRHLSKEQLIEQMVAMRQDGMTYQAIAEVAGVDSKTAWNITHESVLENSKTQPARVTGKDGKHYPSKKPRQPKTVVAFDAKEETRAFEAIEKAGSNLPDKYITTKRVERIGREAENKMRRKENTFDEPVKIDALEIRCGNFPDILNDLRNDSVDLICTDPPYAAEYLPQWSALFVFAQRTLKPGGFLITYCGQNILGDVIKQNGDRGLQYVWTLAQLNTASKKHISHKWHIYSQWKPILVFCKPDFKALNWVNDLINVGNMEKELHDWQQSQQEAEYIISNFTIPGALIVDPFLGSGTVAMATKLLNRNFIGCDIDAACISKTLDRLNEQN